MNFALTLPVKYATAANSGSIANTIHRIFISSLMLPVVMQSVTAPRIQEMNGLNRAMANCRASAIPKFR